MLLNKVFISFYGAKVRQHLINPYYVVNRAKIQEMAELQSKVGNKFPRSHLATDADDDKDCGDLKTGTTADGEQQYDNFDPTLDSFDTSNFISSIKARDAKTKEDDVNQPLVASSSAF